MTVLRQIPLSILQSSRLLPLVALRFDVDKLAKLNSLEFADGFDDLDDYKCAAVEVYLEIGRGAPLSLVLGLQAHSKNPFRSISLLLPEELLNNQFGQEIIINLSRLLGVGENDILWPRVMPPIWSSSAGIPEDITTEHASTDIKKQTADYNSSLIIGSGITVSGSILNARRLIVDGTANLISARLVDLYIHRTGEVSGEVESVNVELSGVFVGSITATACLILKSSGHLIGSAFVHRLIVEEGGTIDGDIKVGVHPVDAVEYVENNDVVDRDLMSSS